MSRVSMGLVALSLGFIVVPAVHGQEVTAAQAQLVVPGGTIDIQNFPIGPFGPQRDTPQATGRATIRGRIVDAQTGQPLRRATVRVSSPAPQVTRTTLSDSSGRYEFTNLPAGRFSINASKSTYVGWSYGQTQPNSPGKPLVLTDAQTADNVDLRLARGSVITGHITDDFGEPVAGAAVTLLRQQYVQGQRRLQQGGGRAITNDIGEFRLYGITPGQYYLSAAEQGVNGNVEGAEARTGYAPTFYPGTPDLAGAQRLTIGLSQTVSDIDIRLSSTPLATVSGTAVDARGAPLVRAFVNLQRRGGLAGIGTNGGAQTKADGTFSIPNVAPGEYLVRANIPGPPPQPGANGAPPNFPVFPTAAVTVNGADVTGVLVAPVTPVSIKGRVVFDDAAAARSVKANTIRVVAQSINVDNIQAIGGPPAPLQDDFTFDLKVAPGPIAIRVNVTGTAPTATNAASPVGWRVKSVRANATDITETGVEVSAQGLTGVEVELTTQQNVVTGGVADGRGTLVKDYVVLLFSQDRGRWTAAINMRSALVRPDDEGRFKIGTLPPGQYYAIALDRVEPNAWQDPDFLDGLSRQASGFTLAAGETRMLDLRLFTIQ